MRRACDMGRAMENVESDLADRFRIGVRLSSRAARLDDWLSGADRPD